MTVHLIFANIFVGAKHFGSKSVILTNKLSTEMLRPCTHRDAPANELRTDLEQDFLQFKNPIVKK